MNSLTLTFSQQHLEKKYQSEISHYRLQTLFVLFFSMDLFFLLYELLFFLIRLNKNYNELLGLIFGFIFLIIILFLRRFYPGLLVYMFTIAFLSQFFFFIELLKRYYDQPALQINFWIFILPLQLLHCGLIFSKIKWFLCSMFYGGSSLYMFLRVTSHDYDEYLSIKIAAFLSNWLLYSFLTYQQEKHSRKAFIQSDESYEKLYDYKSILHNVFPSPIFIVDFGDSKIQFLNKSAQNMLNLQNLNEAANGDAKSNLWANFEQLLDKFSLIQEKPKETQNRENLVSLIKDYYKNPANKAFKASEFLEEPNFHAINVSTKESISSEGLFGFPEIFSKEMKNAFFEIKMIKIVWENKVSLLMKLKDETNIFRISELMNLDEYKNQLLASVSHDLRTPLNGINGMLEISLSKTNDPELKSTLSMAKLSASFLNYLINDILDFSLMNFKKLRLNIQKVNFQDILYQMKQLIGFQAQEKGLEFKITCTCKEFKSVFSDSARIKQILLNLLSNSLKFTNIGHIELLLEDLTEEIPLYRFTVIDTGIGIKNNDLKKLYCLFGKLENPKNLDKTGIGMGLTISKKISKLLCPLKPEGIEVNSVYGSGSKFFFYVSSIMEMDSSQQYPFTDFVKTEENVNFKQLLSMNCRSSFEEIKPLKTSKSIPKASNLKILIVDDDLLSLFILENYIGIFNLSSIRAMNGLEACKLVKKDLKEKHLEIALIIMDCNMPVLDGFQASIKIQNYCKKYKEKKIPILASTANLTASSKARCRNSGMEYILEKPVKKMELKEKIESIFKIKIKEN